MLKKSSFFKTTAATAAISVGIAMSSTAVYAQDTAAAEEADDSDDNVIVVTARKKEETLLDAPLAVSVFGEEQLQEAGFKDVTEISKAAPGVFIEPFSDFAARINTTPRFRGISVLNGSRLQQTATIFLDGVYLSGGAQTIGVNELDRVEIIKGPQSALFGRNTFAGAINYVTKDPSDELRADISVTGATRNEYNLAAGIEGPIADGISFRLSGNYDSKDGHYVNNTVAGERLGDESQWSVSGTLLVEPTDGFRVKLRGSYQEVDDGAAAVQAGYGTRSHNFGGFLITDAATGTVDLNDSVQPAPLGGTRTESVFRGRISGLDPATFGLNSGPAAIAAYLGFLNDGRSDPTDAIFDFKYNPTNVDDFGLKLDSMRLSANASLDLSDNIEFSVLAGYNKENYGFFYDFDNTGDNSFTSFAANEIEDYTVEGRLSGTFLDDSLNVSVGASYVDLDIKTLGGTANFFAFPIFFGDIFRSDPYRTGATTLGIFGSLDYEFNDQLSITLEGRYQQDEITDADVSLINPAISPLKINNFLPRVTARYQPSDLTTLYFTYSEGNLPGGFNPEVAGLDAVQRTELAALAPGADDVFGEEKLTNYEFGWKQAHPDGTFGFNLAAFYMQRSNEIFRSIELVTNTTPGALPPVRTVQFTGNGATTNIYGIELDATLNVSDNFTLQGSFAYVDSTIASFPAGAGTGDFGDIFGAAADVAGQEAPRFPPLSMSLTASYEDDFNAISMFDSWYARADAFFTGSYFISNANVARTDEATDLNLRLGLRGENMGFELFVTNLLDEDAPTGVRNFADVSFGTRTLPGGFFDFSREGAILGLRDKRQFGLRLNYTFR